MSCVLDPAGACNKLFITMEQFLQSDRSDFENVLHWIKSGTAAQTPRIVSVLSLSNSDYVEDLKIWSLTDSQSSSVRNYKELGTSSSDEDQDFATGLTNLPGEMGICIAGTDAKESVSVSSPDKTGRISNMPLPSVPVPMFCLWVLNYIRDKTRDLLVEKLQSAKSDISDSIDSNNLELQNSPSSHMRQHSIMDTSLTSSFAQPYDMSSPGTHLAAHSRVWSPLGGNGASHQSASTGKPKRRIRTTLLNVKTGEVTNLSRGSSSTFTDLNSFPRQSAKPNTVATQNQKRRNKRAKSSSLDKERSALQVSSNSVQQEVGLMDEDDGHIQSQLASKRNMATKFVSKYDAMENDEERVASEDFIPVDSLKEKVGEIGELQRAQSFDVGMSQSRATREPTQNSGVNAGDLSGCRSPFQSLSPSEELPSGQSGHSLGMTPGWRTPPPWQESGARRDARAMRRSLDKLICDPACLKSLADIYACIIQSQRAPSFITELHLLARLLAIHPGVKSKPLHSTIFRSGADCLFFATSVLDCMRFQLLNLGNKLLQRLTEHPAIQTFLPSMANQIHRELENREDNIPSNRPATKRNKQGLSFALPFDFDTDSRQHFQGKQLGDVYKNREMMKDSFLGLLREFMQLQHTLDAKKVLQFEKQFPQRARACLFSLQPCNMSWFSSFFLRQLMQNAMATFEAAEGAKMTGDGVGALASLSSKMFKSEIGGAGNKLHQGSLSKLQKLQMRMSSSQQSTANKDSVSSSSLKMLGARRVGDRSRSSSFASTKSKKLRASSRENEKGSHKSGGINKGGDHQNVKHGRKKSKKGKWILKQPSDIDNIARMHRQRNSSKNAQQHLQQQLQKGRQEAQDRDVFQFVSTGSKEIDRLFPKPLHRFFILFLRATDSNMLFSNVRIAACAMLDKLSTFQHGSNHRAHTYADHISSIEEADSIFAYTERDNVANFQDELLQARVVAQVLGYILHGHNWSTGLAQVFHMNSLPFETDLRNSVRAVDRCDPVFDTKERLWNAWKSGNLVLVIPWLVEILRMAKFDEVCIRSQYFKDVLHLFRQIRLRPAKWISINGAETKASDTMRGSHSMWESMNYQYVVIKIEQLFLHLDVPIENFEDAMDESSYDNVRDTLAIRSEMQSDALLNAADLKPNLITEHLMSSSCGMLDDILRILVVNHPLDQPMGVSAVNFNESSRPGSPPINSTPYKATPEINQPMTPTGDAIGRASSTKSSNHRASTRKIRPVNLGPASGRRSMHVSGPPVVTSDFSSSFATSISLNTAKKLFEKRLLSNKSTAVSSDGFAPSNLHSKSSENNLESGGATKLLNSSLASLSLSSAHKSSTSSPAMEATGLNTKDLELLRSELSKTFFRNHPLQMRLCHFAIDAVVQNAIEYAMNRSVVPLADIMAADVTKLHMQFVEQKKLSKKSTYKSAQLNILRKYRSDALLKAITHANKYCDQFVPQVILSVAPFHMVHVQEDAQSGDLSIRPMGTNAVVSSQESKSAGLGYGNSRSFTRSATLLAAIPLILDLARTFVEEKLQIRVKTFFRLQIEKCQNEISKSADPTPLESSKNESIGKSHKGSSAQLDTKTKAVNKVKGASTKQASRLTASGKLISCFIAESEAQRSVCLAILKVSHLIRQFASLKSSNRFPSGEKASIENELVNTRQAKVVSILDAIHGSLEPSLAGLFRKRETLTKDIELSRLVVTGHVVESIILVLLVFSAEKGSRALALELSVRRVVSALVGAISTLILKFPAVAHGVSGAVINRVALSGSKHVMPCLRLFINIVETTDISKGVSCEEYLKSFVQPKKKTQ